MQVGVPGAWETVTGMGLATYNIKGGAGRTSAAVNLAYLAARAGATTLLWDLDPQGGSTYLLRVKPKVRGGGRKLVGGKSDASTRTRAPTSSASTCVRPISRTATCAAHADSGCFRGR